jgi:hypothetical protein
MRIGPLHIVWHEDYHQQNLILLCWQRVANGWKQIAELCQDDLVRLQDEIITTKKVNSELRRRIDALEMVAPERGE